MVILKSFIPGNLISLYMTIINSVVMVRLYYGFLTTLSIEEGTEKRVSATTGFIAGQLMMFISIYYVPLHLALGKPHTITVLALPYLLFHFFWNNHNDFFDHKRPTRNSMRNLSIQCVFLNNLIIQLFNHFILPSSMLASFFGWLIGHILLMKWVGSNVLIRSNKYLVSKFRNSMARIFSILLFITCVYYLGRIPSPILAKKLKGISELEEVGESEEERNIEIETISDGGGANQKQGTEENTSSSLFRRKRANSTFILKRHTIKIDRFINELKRRNLSKEFIKRVESIDKGSFDLGILEKMTRFSNNETKREYLPKLYDPFLHGPYRGRIKKWDTLNIKSLATEKELSLLTLIEDEHGNIDSEDRVKIFKFLFNIVITNPNNQTIRKKSIGIKEISKKEGENEENVTAEHEIHSRKSKRVVIFTNNQANADTYTNTKDANDPDQTDEVALIRYSQLSDFQHDIIKGSMLAQRRKTITWELFQENVHSPLFLGRVDKPLFFSFDVSGPLKRISRNWILIRGSVLITQSILRKYIILPSLIIVKNIALFPKNWLTDDIQIKILFPFCLKPWHRFKLQPSHKDPMKKRKGMETELPFGFPRKRRSEPYELGETKKDSIISNKMIHYFEERGVSHSRLRNHYGLRQKIVWHSGMNEWKNWLRSRYQYDLVQNRWLKLVPGQWRNRRDPYTYGSPFQVNKREESSYHYNMDKQIFFDTLRDIPIHNYLGEGDILDAMGNFSHRKFLNWRILDFCLRNKVDIESWVDTSTNSKKNIKTVVKNYQIIDKMDLFYFTIYQDQESNPSNKKGSHFDWMGLNEEIVSHPIPNLELWFFPEFVLLYNAYKVKPWIIPIKLLLFNFNGNRNINKNIIENKKRDSLIAPNEKQIIGSENRNQEEKEPIGEGGLTKKRSKEKQYKSNTEAELDFFLKRYLRFQLRWDDSLNQRIINNIKVYCLLLRLINPNEIMTKNKDKNHYDLFVPENILSPNHRQELRIQISFNSRDKNVLTKNKHLDSDKKKLIKLKFFLWPNYRLEDLACMNRYWFNTNNGSRFSMIRIRMYPRLKIR
ncbi:hypothetical protein ES332_A13G105200v1 [Gossypium tomentosum]|uniref:Translocon at the inner envelope membrane of chloroplasts 214 n=1 Tax=Gossypium tomentosum TaxID=34277 RepID=A0A5D2MII2_GOSTO|nr:hypothetical protein ES332_A13G105200v1 [Gossypium tomentosum]